MNYINHELVTTIVQAACTGEFGSLVFYGFLHKSYYEQQHASSPDNTRILKENWDYFVFSHKVVLPLSILGGIIFALMK